MTDELTCVKWFLDFEQVCHRRFYSVYNQLENVRNKRGSQVRLKQQENQLQQSMMVSKRNKVLFSSLAGDSRPDVGGSSVLHHQTVLVEVSVHVGNVLRCHQLRHLQSYSQAAVLQDAEVRRGQTS